MDYTQVCLGSRTAFDLEQTLDCGQCFRFAPHPDRGWVGVVESHPIHIWKQDDQFLLECEPFDGREAYWKRYFDWERDYPAIGRRFAAYPAVTDGMAYAPGLRILRQPAFEALLGFIISQNNNIKRIKGIVARLCSEFGKPMETPWGKTYAFPTPEVLSGLSEQDLAPLRSGWRAAYLLDAGQKVATGEIDLAAIEKMPIDEARATLQTIHGVGPKVAECVLLYGMGRMEAFPLDVWMKRAMKTWLPDTPPEQLGPYAGIAQQYLFHYSRHHAEELEKSGKS